MAIAKWRGGTTKSFHFEETNHQPKYTQNWQKELQDFLLMYRSTPHSTTRRTPSELMFGRTILDKLPHMNESIIADEEMSDRDKIEKEKGKQFADKRRHAQENTIEVGETVWLKCLINKNKLSPTFEPIDYKVISRSGSELLVENVSSGVQYRRNITHVKRAVRHGQIHTSESSILFYFFSFLLNHFHFI